MRKKPEMKECRLSFVFSCLLVCVIVCSCTFGCRHAVERTGQPMGANPAEVPDEASVNSTRANLSMAKELKNPGSAEYILGPGDTLKISVFRFDEMKLETTIGPTGRISYFLVGDVEAGGLTRVQFRDRLEKLLKKYIKKPEVIVRISEYRSHKVVFLGQVNNPGVYRMRDSMTLVEGISEAGGVGPDAYLGGAYIVRDGKILLVNFFELIEKGNMGENIPLAKNDLIYIPSNKDQKIYVLGEVNNQSAISLRQGLNLLGAIAEAGGFTRDAKKESIIVMRGNMSNPEIMKIDAKTMDPRTNIYLERGDIVYVASSTIANVERMALRLYNILQPFYNLARTVVWGDATVGVMEGKDSRLVISD